MSMTMACFWNRTFADVTRELQMQSSWTWVGSTSRKSLLSLYEEDWTQRLREEARPVEARGQEEYGYSHELRKLVLHRLERPDQLSPRVSCVTY